jgi:hypothetical protein
MSKFNYIYADPSTAGQSVGATPYGIYDNDIAFQSESLQVCKFVSRRLGHPVMQIEFNSGSIYTCFEEAISEYSQQIHHYNMKNWLWEQYGASEKVSGSGYGNDGTTSQMGTGSNSVVNPHLGSNFILSDQYGEAVNVGGGVELYSGSIALTGSKQVYDLTSDAKLNTSHTGKRIEVQRVFNYGPAAITKFYDPYAGSFDQQQMLDTFGMGNVAPAVTYIMRPVSHDIARAQAIETSDKIRKSAYSFELINNKLRIFPRPVSGSAGDKIYFNYYVKDEKGSTTRDWTSDKVSDPSNAPYKFVTYDEINAPARQWIRKYCLALSKELLGIIRSKYASMPLPNGDVTLDGEGLKAEGREEKIQLQEELKEFLDSVTLKERAVGEQETADAQQSVLNKAPLGIYIG